MKSSLLTMAVLCCYCFYSPASAQTVVASETFDSCADGDYAAVCSPHFTTWDLAPGTASDATITSSNSAMGANSMHITGPAGGGAIDMVMDLGDRTGGIYKLEFYIYVEQGAGGYFNVLHTFSPPATFEWALDVFFSMDGTGSINANGNDATTFTYTNGAWNHVTIDVDLETVMAELSIAGTSVYVWPFDTQGGGGAGVNQLAAANFYSTAPAGEASDYYIDEVVFTEVSGVGINETSASHVLSVFPNPANESLTIDVAGFNPTKASIQVLDVTGKNVALDIPRINTSETRLTVDVSELPNGVYFLSVDDGTQQLVRKLVKQ